MFGLFAFSGDLVSILRREVALALSTLAINVPEEVVTDPQVGIMAVVGSVEPIALVRGTVARVGYAVALVGRVVALIGYVVTRLRALLPPSSILSALHRPDLTPHARGALVEFVRRTSATGAT